VSFERQCLVGGSPCAGGTVTVAPGGVSCTATCSTNFPPATAVTLQAAPDGMSFFQGWSGAGCSGTGDCKLTLNQATTVTARFGFTPF
jgi:hypothetical protein